jgi:hypothetical protein
MQLTQFPRACEAGLVQMLLRLNKRVTGAFLRGRTSIQSQCKQGHHRQFFELKSLKVPLAKFLYNHTGIASSSWIACVTN